MDHVRKSLSAVTVHLTTVACVKQPHCVHACCQSNQKEDVVRCNSEPNEQHAAYIKYILYNILSYYIISNVLYNVLKSAENKKAQQLHVEINIFP